jgi:hypothetical protein
MARLTDEQREAHEWGQVERDCAELADYSRHGGWLFRFLKWMEGLARREREELRKERRDV